MLRSGIAGTLACIVKGNLVSRTANSTGTIVKFMTQSFALGVLTTLSLTSGRCGTGSVGQVVAQLLTFGVLTALSLTSGRYSTGSVGQVVAQLLALGVLTALSLTSGRCGTSSVGQIVSQLLTLSGTTLVAGLRLGTSRILPIVDTGFLLGSFTVDTNAALKLVTTNFALFFTATIAGLGSLAGSISKIMTQSFARGVGTTVSFTSGGSNTSGIAHSVT